MGLEGGLQKGCHSHHQYHRNLGPRNDRKCQIQMCFELEEINLKVVMMGLETRGGQLLGWRGSCGDGGVVKLVWIRGVCNCVELFASLSVMDYF